MDSSVKKEIGLDLLAAEGEAELKAERDSLLNQTRLMMLPGFLKKKLESESLKIGQEG